MVEDSGAQDDKKSKPLGLILSIYIKNKNKKPHHKTVTTKDKMRDNTVLKKEDSTL